MKKTKTYVFECYKCGHELHADESKLDKVIKTECPNCGEEPYRLWILIQIVKENNE